MKSILHDQCLLEAFSFTLFILQTPEPILKVEVFHFNNHKHVFPSFLIPILKDQKHD